MVRLLTDLQQRALDRLDELAAIGVPDRRLGTMLPRIADVVEQWGGPLELAERRSLDALVTGLPTRLSASTTAVCRTLSYTATSTPGTSPADPTTT